MEGVTSTSLALFSVKIPVNVSKVLPSVFIFDWGGERATHFFLIFFNLPPEIQNNKSSFAKSLLTN